MRNLCPTHGKQIVASLAYTPGHKTELISYTVAAKWAERVRVAKVRLIKKFAAVMDGVDLSRANAGDEIELSSRDAQVLIAEGWAVPVKDAQRHIAADKERKRPRRSKT